MVTKVKKKVTKKTTKKKAVKKKTTAKKKNTIDEIGTTKTSTGTRRLVGRPTKYSADFCEIVVECMSKGFSKEAVAGHLFISKQTLYRWEKDYPEFSDALKIGVELSRLHWEGLSIDYKTFTQKSGKRIEATTWIFNMKNRFGWADKQEIKSEETSTQRVLHLAFNTNESPDDVDKRGGDDPDGE